MPGGPGEEYPGDGLNWNAKNLKIINLKDGTLPMDAINKRQLEAIIPDIEEQVRRAEEAAKAAEGKISLQIYIKIIIIMNIHTYFFYKAQ